MSDDLDVLWQPLKLRGATLPNRIMTTATTVQYGVAGMVNERHLHFYRERARGGVGLMFTEQLTATPLSDTGFPTSISAHDERQVERLAMVREALEPYPTRFFGQLVAGGATAASTGGLDVWGPARGPSDVGMAGGESTLPFSRDEIAQVVADYARSAANVKAAGLHGVEVHGSHGWLVGQFLSPFYNRRDDEYGGPVENRCRLALEIGHALRAEVGDDYPVGLALTYDEVMGDAGITLEDTLAQLEVLVADGVYDFYDLSIGAGHSAYLTISSMAVPEGYPIPAAARAKQLVGDRAAIFVAGRIVDLAMAARAVADGSTDIVGMTRAHLADPHLVRKAREGRKAETTRCIGANVCVGRALRAQQVTCVLTPATGREATLGHGTLEQAANAGPGDRDRGRSRRPAHRGDRRRARARGDRARARRTAGRARARHGLAAHARPLVARDRGSRRGARARRRDAAPAQQADAGRADRRGSPMRWSSRPARTGRRAARARAGPTARRSP